MIAKTLKCTLFTQGISIILTLITKGTFSNIFFSIFWLSTIVSLLSILSLKKWDIEEWFCFGAIAFSLVGGVLYAIRALIHDGIIMSLITILLIIASSSQRNKCSCTTRKTTGVIKKDIIIKKLEPHITAIEVERITPKKRASKKTTKVVKKATTKKSTKKAPAKKKTASKKKSANTKKTTKKTAAKKTTGQRKTVSSNKVSKKKTTKKVTTKK